MILLHWSFIISFTTCVISNATFAYIHILKWRKNDHISHNHEIRTITYLKANLKPLRNLKFPFRILSNCSWLGVANGWIGLDLDGLDMDWKKMVWISIHPNRIWENKDLVKYDLDKWFHPHPTFHRSTPKFFVFQK